MTRSEQTDDPPPAIRPPGVRPPDPWHALPHEQVAAHLGSGPDGLSDAEAAARLAHHGANRLPEGRPRPAWLRLLAQFHNLLIYVLLAAAAIALALHEFVDAAVILAVVLVNAAIGFVQEGRAERSLNALREMVSPQASVRRDGRRMTLPAAELVPGDLVLLDPGDRVPADLRLTRARGLRIQEAALTGESAPVEKGAAPVPAEALLGDRSAMAHSGTLVAAGQGQGVVVATGAATELGRVGTMLHRVESLKTPLIRQMDGLARQLTLFILLLAAGTFAIAFLLRGYGLAEAFMAVVGLAVAAIPEGLPAVMTIALAIGVQRMAARHAIIRRLPAVETLGAVGVICTDKTGTLTRNEMTARSLVTAAGEWTADGAGYAPEGAFGPAGGGARDTLPPVIRRALQAGLMCNDARLGRRGADWLVDGDPMEGALLALAAKAGLDPVAERQAAPRRDEIPFDAQHRFMAVLHDGGDGPSVFLKGAPERLLELCDRERGPAGDRPLDAAFWHGEAERLAASGQRVLALAERAPPSGGVLDFAEVDRGGAILLGLVGLIDPPRPEAVAAVADCHAAGIRVVMITGDHAVTAAAIAAQLGLAPAPRVLTGRELAGMDDAALAAAVRETDVFARTTPEDKLRLVAALQAQGQTVAMTGDGVNDAPALKRADVGVAMGLRGTEAAKEAAEMVLADDNFASIVAAVREGRTVYDNLRKVIGWTLPTSSGEALTILVAIGFGFALPVTPVQILWVNMITAVALGLALAFEPTEPGTMARPPRPRAEPLLPALLLWQIAYVSLLFVAGAFGIFFWAEGRGIDIDTARTMVVNALVVMEVFYLFSIRYVHGTALTLRGVVGTPAVLLGLAAVVAAQFAMTYLPAMNLLLGTRPLALADGAATIAIGIAVLALCEVEKAVRRRLLSGARG